MSRASEVYSLSKGYSPFIYKSEMGYMYCFPVSSGHAELSVEFPISEQDLEILKSDAFRFKAFYFILFRETQATFGTGHPNPRRYTFEEFEAVKKRVLYLPEIELKNYIKLFSKQMNLADDYFKTFSKNVFGKRS